MMLNRIVMAIIRGRNSLLILVGMISFLKKEEMFIMIYVLKILEFSILFIVIEALFWWVVLRFMMIFGRDVFRVIVDSVMIFGLILVKVDSL